MLNLQVCLATSERNRLRQRVTHARNFNFYVFESNLLIKFALRILNYLDLKVTEQDINYNITIQYTNTTIQYTIQIQYNYKLQTAVPLALFKRKKIKYGFLIEKANQ